MPDLNRETVPDIALPDILHTKEQPRKEPPCRRIIKLQQGVHICQGKKEKTFSTITFVHY